MSSEDKKVTRNIDGEIIDYSKDDLYEKLTFETASIGRRLAAYLIDAVIIIGLLYLVSILLFNPIDTFVQYLGTNPADFEDPAEYEKLVQLFYRLILNIGIAWFAIRLVYFTLVPAIIGDGRTVGKLIAGIGVVDIQTLEEISPTRLMLRELIGRNIIETLLIIPGIVSIVVSLVRKDSRGIRDLMAKTVVIKLDLYNL